MATSVKYIGDMSQSERDSFAGEVNRLLFNVGAYCKVGGLEQFRRSFYYPASGVKVDVSKVFGNDRVVVRKVRTESRPPAAMAWNAIILYMDDGTGKVTLATVSDGTISSVGDGAAVSLSGSLPSSALQVFCKRFMCNGTYYTFVAMPFSVTKTANGISLRYTGAVSWYVVDQNLNFMAFPSPFDSSAGIPYRVAAGSVVGAEPASTINFSDTMIYASYGRTCCAFSVVGGEVATVDTALAPRTPFFSTADGKFLMWETRVDCSPSRAYNTHILSNGWVSVYDLGATVPSYKKRTPMLRGATLFDPTTESEEDHSALELSYEMDGGYKCSWGRAEGSLSYAETVTGTGYNYASSLDAKSWEDYLVYPDGNGFDVFLVSVDFAGVYAASNADGGHYVYTDVYEDVYVYDGWYSSPPGLSGAPGTEPSIDEFVAAMQAMYPDPGGGWLTNPDVPVGTIWYLGGGAPYADMYVMKTGDGTSTGGDAGTHGLYHTERRYVRTDSVWVWDGWASYSSVRDRYSFDYPGVSAVAAEYGAFSASGEGSIPIVTSMVSFEAWKPAYLGATVTSSASRNLPLEIDTLSPSGFSGAVSLVEKFPIGTETGFFGQMRVVSRATSYPATGYSGNFVEGLNLAAVTPTYNLVTPFGLTPLSERASFSGWFYAQDNDYSIQLQAISSPSRTLFYNGTSFMGSVASFVGVAAEDIVTVIYVPTAK